MAQDYRIEFVPLSDIQRWPRNPKLHDEKGMDESLERFGFINPLVMDERTGKLVAGHGRIEALGRRREAGKPPPARVVVKGKEWLVPVVRGVSFKSDAEAESYLLADNRLTENGGWNEKELADLLKSLSEQSDFAGTGFAEDEVEKLLSKPDVSLGDTNALNEWQGMPEFNQPNNKAFRSIIMHFDNQQDVEDFVTLLAKRMKGLSITENTRYLWFPELKIDSVADTAYVTPADPKPSA